MKIIDAHHHLWCPVKDTADIGYVWLKNIGAMKPFGDPTSIQRDYLVEEFQAESEKHELVGSVHVQADGGIPDPVKESEWLESLNEKTALPSVHVGFLDLAKPDAQQVLERYLPLKGFRGVRQILSRIDDNRAAAAPLAGALGRTEGGVERAARRAGKGQVPRARVAADKLPSQERRTEFCVCCIQLRRRRRAGIRGHKGTAFNPSAPEVP